MSAAPVRLLHLDTAKRSGGSISSPSWDVSGYEVKDIKYVAVQSCEFPSTAYNITSTTNKMQVVNNTDVKTYNITITPGFYDSTALNTAVVAALQAADALGWSSTLNTAQATFTIANTSAKSFTIVLPTSTLGPVMGFTVSSTSATSATSDSMSALNTLPYIYIGSNSLTSCCQVNGQSVNVLHKQQMTAPFGSYCLYLAQNAYPVFTVAGNIDTLRLQALDSALQTVDTHGKDWSITLAMWR